MITKLVSVATLFAASSILLAGNPTLGAKSLDNQASPSASLELRCGGSGGGRRCGGGGGGGRRCGGGGGGRRCGGGGGRRCGAPIPACATRSCAARVCGAKK